MELVFLSGLKACLIASLFPYLYNCVKNKIFIVLVFLIVISICVFWLESRMAVLILLLQIAWFEKERFAKYQTFKIPFLLFFGIVFFLVKINSSFGRVFIWKNTILHIFSIPFFGFGSHNFQYNYAIWQSEYFANHTKWSRAHYVADVPKFAYNDWLQFAVEYGIVFSVILVVLLFAALKLSKPKKGTMQEAAILSLLSIIGFSMIGFVLHSYWVLLMVMVNFSILYFHLKIRYFVMLATISFCVFVTIKYSRIIILPIFQTGE